MESKGWKVLRNFKEKDDRVEYNYFKITSSDGEVVSYCAAEKGSSNEIKVVDSCMELGFKLEKVSKEEYDSISADAS